MQCIKYQSKGLIIKGLDNQTQVYKYVCLIIKSLDTQAQKLNNQFNQYLSKSLIIYLGMFYNQTSYQLPCSETQHSTI